MVIPQRISRLRLAAIVWPALAVGILSGCAQELNCVGNSTVDLARAHALQSGVRFSSGARARLLFPNPLDAASVTALSSARLNQLESTAPLFGLLDLLNSNRLETSYFRVRQKERQEAGSILANPNSQGVFQFDIASPHYSEAMAFYSISTLQNYFKTLGFGDSGTKPLYVFVRSPAASEDEDFNAYYDDHADGGAAEIQLVGDGERAPATDAMIVMHEYSHRKNEEASGRVGIDRAKLGGAIYSEGGAIHEAFADRFPETFNNVPKIGAWLAGNFSDIPAGEPLRRAVEANGKPLLKFADVAYNDGSGGLDVYVLGEWLTRVLWDIHQQFLKEDATHGRVSSDRLALTALKYLGKDTSVLKLYKGLQQADQDLFCGIHQRTVQNAFLRRGFSPNPPALSHPLRVVFKPVGLTEDGIPQGIVAGGILAFQIGIQNTANTDARNVRIFLKSLDTRLHVSTYMQGMGDLKPGQQVQVGGSGGMGYEFSVMADIDQAAPQGISLPFQISVEVENGLPTITKGEVKL